MREREDGRMGERERVCVRVLETVWKARVGDCVERGERP